MKKLDMGFFPIDITRMEQQLFYSRYKDDQDTIMGLNEIGQKSYDYRSENMAYSIRLCETFHKPGVIVILGYRHGLVQTRINSLQHDLKLLQDEYMLATPERKYCSYFLYSSSKHPDNYGVTLSAEGEERSQLIEKDFCLGLNCIDTIKSSNEKLWEIISKDVNSNKYPNFHCSDRSEAKLHYDLSGKCYKKYGATKDKKYLSGARLYF